MRLKQERECVGVRVQERVIVREQYWERERERGSACVSERERKSLFCAKNGNFRRL